MRGCHRQPAYLLIPKQSRFGQKVPLVWSSQHPMFRCPAGMGMYNPV